MCGMRCWHSFRQETAGPANASAAVVGGSHPERCGIRIVLEQLGIRWRPELAPR